MMHVSDPTFYMAVVLSFLGVVHADLKLFLETNLGGEEKGHAGGV